MVFQHFFFTTGYNLTLSKGWLGFPGGTSGKEPPSNAGDIRDGGSTPSCEDPLEMGMAARSENHMDRGAWRATVHRVAESDMTEWLTTHARKT